MFCISRHYIQKTNLVQIIEGIIEFHLAYVFNFCDLDSEVVLRVESAVLAP